MRNLRVRVRAALAAGVLPLGRISSVVRRASGRPCFICGEAIPPTELEKRWRASTKRPHRQAALSSIHAGSALVREHLPFR